MLTKEELESYKKATYDKMRKEQDVIEKSNQPLELKEERDVIDFMEKD